MISRSAVRAIALVAALSTASCSWLVMTPAPDSPVRTAPNCSTTRLPAVIDLSFGIPYLLVGILLLVFATDETGSDQEALQLGGGAITAMGAVYTWSGVSGLRMAGECRDAEAEYEEWINNPETRAVPRNPWDRAPVRPGAEGGMCARENACDPGLTCASGFCVRLP